MKAILFIVGVIAALLANWIWALVTDQSHRKLVRHLDEHKAAQENQRLLEQFMDEGLPDWNRRQIWRRMTWIWKETRGWIIRSGRVLNLFWLFLFAVLYTSLWLKTLLFPDSHDLRLLLGGRSWLMYVVQKENSSSGE